MRVLMLTAVSLIIFDQVSKYAAQQLGYVVINKGISFGLFGILPNGVLIAVTAIILAGIVWLLESKMQQHPIISALFLAGGASNILDRFFFAGVRDWLPVPFLNVYNNFADWYIGAGCFVVLVGFILKKETAHEP